MLSLHRSRLQTTFTDATKLYNYWYSVNETSNIFIIYGHFTKIVYYLRYDTEMRVIAVSEEDVEIVTD